MPISVLVIDFLKSKMNRNMRFQTMCNQQRLRPACVYQPAHKRSLIKAFASRLNIL